MPLISSSWRLVGFLMDAISNDGIKLMQIRPNAQILAEKLLKDLSSFIESGTELWTIEESDLM